MGRPKKETTLNVAAEQPPKRVYGNNAVMDHDLFKLKVAKMKKNVSYIESSPNYQDVEHSHFFHTIDSQGRAQVRCSEVGGHFHEIELVPSKDPESPPEVKVGPAMRYVLGPKQAPKPGALPKRKRKAVPCQEDGHTHEGVYVRSEQIQPRKRNVEFAKISAQLDPASGSMLPQHHNPSLISKEVK